MSEIDCAALLPAVVAIAQTAGHKILAIYNSSDDLRVMHKDDNSFITEADLASHRYILTELGKLLQNVPIISEESMQKPFHSELFWLVDPLDGTKEFVARTGHFTINIALVHEQKPILGVVYAPYLNELYYAADKKGAFFAGKDSHIAKPIQTRPLVLPYRVLTSKRHNEHIMLNELLKKLVQYEILHCGSAIKICWVARGLADIYPRYGDTCGWDTAAGQVILMEAGGLLVNKDGAPLNYDSNTSLLNPWFFALSHEQLTKFCCG